MNADDQRYMKVQLTSHEINRDINIYWRSGKTGFRKDIKRKGRARPIHLSRKDRSADVGEHAASDTLPIWTHEKAG